MFYSHSLLSKKGPLGTIWVAAYSFKKLKKDQIADTDISSSIDKIMSEVQMSYRVLAQLLLGIVRIFSKKVDYLYHDCDGVITIMRKSFMPSQRTVPKEAIVRPRRITQTREATCEPDKSVTKLKEAIFSAQMEDMGAANHNFTITIPRRFELDSFDLDIADESDTGKPHKQLSHQDGWTDERNEILSLNEYYRRGTFAHTEFDYACFTPVEDVFPSHIMDIDLGINEHITSLEARREKILRDFQHQEECTSHERFGAKKSLVTNLQSGESESEAHCVNLQKAISSVLETKTHAKESQNEDEHKMLQEIVSLSYESLQEPMKEHSKAATPDRIHGLASPKFMVRTPAKKERIQISRKRKSIFDETIVLSNKTLRLGIHDASSLIFKRGKAPHTFLDAWKADRIANLQQNFTDPLITCMSPELKALFRSKSSIHSPQKIPADPHIESGNAESGIPYETAHFENLRWEASVETPAPERRSEEPSRITLDEGEIRRTSYSRTSDTELDLMDRELGSDKEGGVHQDDGWSDRTRRVARYLRSRFLDLKSREQKDVLSLACILEGKTRRTCAKFFYETLILKDHHCIGVKQDSPYSDIIIIPTPRLEAEF